MSNADSSASTTKKSKPSLPHYRLDRNITVSKYYNSSRTQRRRQRKSKYSQNSIWRTVRIITTKIVKKRRMSLVFLMISIKMAKKAKLINSRQRRERKAKVRKLKIRKKKHPFTKIQNRQNPLLKNKSLLSKKGSHKKYKTKRHRQRTAIRRRNKIATLAKAKIKSKIKRSRHKSRSSQ